jgi:hypothetical protein
VTLVLLEELVAQAPAGPGAGASRDSPACVPTPTTSGRPPSSSCRRPWRQETTAHSWRVRTRVPRGSSAGRGGGSTSPSSTRGVRRSSREGSGTTRCSRWP